MSGGSDATKQVAVELGDAVDDVERLLLDLRVVALGRQERLAGVLDRLLCAALVVVMDKGAGVRRQGDLLVKIVVGELLEVGQRALTHCSSAHCQSTP